MIKAIIFDLDDTLLQTRKIRIQALIDFAQQRYQFSLTHSRVNQIWGIPYEKMMETLFGTYETVDQVIQKHKNHIQKYPNRAYPGTKETLEQLYPSHFLGIVSAASTYLIHNDLESGDIDSTYFTLIQSADDTDHHKPDPRVFDSTKKELATHHISREEILYVGDSFKDYYAARDAGLNFIGIADRTTPSTDFDKEQVTFIKNLTELPERLIYL